MSNINKNITVETELISPPTYLYWLKLGYHQRNISYTELGNFGITAVTFLSCMR